MRPISLELFIAVFFMFGIAISAASPVEISVNPSSQIVEKGQEFTLNISIDPVNNPITAAQFNLLFNSDSIEVRNVSEGPLFKQTGANTSFNSGTLNNGGGTLINVWGLIITPGANVTTKDTLTTITVYAKEAGTSSFNLTNVIISDPDSNAVQINISNVSVDLIAPSQKQSSGGGGGSSGGGGGGGTSGENFSNIEIKEKYDLFINKDQTTFYLFKKTDPIISVNITGNNNAGEINVAVEVLRNTSSLVNGPAPDAVYKNVNIWAGTYGFATPKNIKHAEIVFRIPKSWIESNNIDMDSIILMHYDGTWESLPTKKLSETAEWIYYEASTTSFSPFAITGKISYVGVSQTTANTESQQVVKPVSRNQKAAPDSPGDLSKYLIIGAFIGIALNAALIYKIRKSKERSVGQEDL